MYKPLFTGACTALVTPFLDGRINYPMLEQLLRRQIASGIRSFVICGTTGEASTLSNEEKIDLIQRAKQYVGDSCTIIAGTGSNNTAHAISLSVAAEQAGADGLLLVSPYYNKATPEGLYLHYKAIADMVHIPIILYNVPSRTGVDIPISVYQRLAIHPNIAGVKEASADIAKLSKIKSYCPNAFSVWTGNDEHIVPAMALGCEGVISVLSNVVPGKTQILAQAALAGDFDTAAALQIELQPLAEALFSEVNPIPVKEAMRLIGYDCGSCRLPLCTPTENTSKLLKQLLTSDKDCF